MATYGATFIAGTKEIILRQLKQFSLEQLKITYSDDSFMLFSSSLPEAKITNFRFFNNVFTVLAENINNVPLKQFLQEALINAASSSALADKRFRLSVMDKDGLKNINPKLRQELTQAIATKYNMTESAHRPDVEFWFILRRSGFGIFGWKLPRVQFKHDDRPAGALRPQLVHILGLVAGLNSRDSILDPFAGSGVILEEGLAGFHVKHAIALEKDRKLITSLKKKPKIEVIEGDATDLSFIEPDSINKVITDPPWGSFTKLNDREIDKLYSGAFKEIAHVLKAGGVAVILSDAQKAVQHAESVVANLSLIKEYPILVSGHKATIYKFRKN